jgi:hypothetical protein
MADKQPKGQRVPGTNTFDVQEPSAPLTPEEKRKNAAALAKQKADEKKPINPDVSQEPSSSASKPFAKGGRVTRGDGCAQRGKTKGKNR